MISRIFCDQYELTLKKILSEISQALLLESTSTCICIVFELHELQCIKCRRDLLVAHVKYGD